MKRWVEKTGTISEPVRVEKKLIHGEWVDVKIYKLGFVPDNRREVKTLSKLKFEVTLE